jgi:AcrR family transcriptional regulator
VSESGEVAGTRVDDILRRVRDEAPRPADDRGTRELILAAATRRFAQVGYGKTSIKEIAAEAGVSTGPVYHHFGSKAALFREIGNWTSELLLETFGTVTSATTRRARAEALFTMIAAMAAEHTDDHWMGVRLGFETAKHTGLAGTRDAWGLHVERVFRAALASDPQLDDDGWDHDPLLVVVMVLALGGSWNLVRNGSAALAQSTEGVLRLLAGPQALAPRPVDDDGQGASEDAPCSRLGS